MLRAAAQQKHVRAFQDLKESNFGFARVPPQRVLMTVRRDEYLFGPADPVFGHHIRGKLGDGCDLVGSLADQRQQCAIGLAEQA